MWYDFGMCDRSGLPIVVRPLADHGREDDLRKTTAEERIAMMWPLALDAWAFKGEPVLVIQIGIAPRRIDILTSISGVAFNEAWESRQGLEIDGQHVNVLSRTHLIQNKRAAGRPKDLADLAWLELEKP
jgi:hypothetical protein